MFVVGRSLHQNPETPDRPRPNRNVSRCLHCQRVIQVAKRHTFPMRSKGLDGKRFSHHGIHLHEDIRNEWMRSMSIQERIVSTCRLLLDRGQAVAVKVFTTIQYSVAIRVSILPIGGDPGPPIYAPIRHPSRHRPYPYRFHRGGRVTGPHRVRSQCRRQRQPALRSNSGCSESTGPDASMDDTFISCSSSTLPESGCHSSERASTKVEDVVPKIRFADRTF